MLIIFVSLSTTRLHALDGPSQISGAVGLNPDTPLQTSLFLPRLIHSGIFVAQKALIVPRSYLASSVLNGNCSIFIGPSKAS